MIEAFRDLAGFGVMLIDTPQANNRIVLDESGAPQIDYTLSAADKKRFAEGIAEAIRVMFKAGAKEVYLPTTEDILGSQKRSAAGRMGMQPQVLTSPDQAALVEKNLTFRRTNPSSRQPICRQRTRWARAHRTVWSARISMSGELRTLRCRWEHLSHVRRSESDAKHLYRCEDLCRSLESPAITHHCAQVHS